MTVSLYHSVTLTFLLSAGTSNISVPCPLLDLLFSFCTNDVFYVMVSCLIYWNFYTVNKMDDCAMHGLNGWHRRLKYCSCHCLVPVVLFLNNTPKSVQICRKSFFCNRDNVGITFLFMFWLIYIYIIIYINIIYI